MNPSPAAISWIQAQAGALPGGWGGNGNAQVLAAILGNLVANTAAQGQSPGPFTPLGALGQISGASLAKLVSAGLIPSINQTVNAGDRAGLAEWAQLAADDALITQAEATAIGSYAAATVPDPTWQAQVPAAIAAIGRVPDILDVAAARPVS